MGKGIVIASGRIIDVLLLGRRGILRVVSWKRKRVRELRLTGIGLCPGGDNYKCCVFGPWEGARVRWCVRVGEGSAGKEWNCSFLFGFSNVKVVIALGQSCICNLRTSLRKATVETSHVMMLWRIDAWDLAIIFEYLDWNSSRILNPPGLCSLDPR